MSLYKALDPQLNMDLCCCGLMASKKAIALIGALELIGAVVACVVVLLDPLSNAGQWQVR